MARSGENFEERSRLCGVTTFTVLSNVSPLQSQSTTLLIPPNHSLYPSSFGRQVFNVGRKSNDKKIMYFSLKFGKVVFYFVCCLRTIREISLRSNKQLFKEK